MELFTKSTIESPKNATIRNGFIIRVWYLLQGLQPHWQEADLFTMRSHFLLRVFEAALRTQNDKVSLRQNSSSQHPWEFPCQLSSADSPANGSFECGLRLGCERSGQFENSIDQVLRHSSFQESEVLLQEWQNDVLLQMYSQTHRNEAWSYSNIS